MGTGPSIQKSKEPDNGMKRFIFSVFFLLAAMPCAYAQPKPPAMPVAKVTAEALHDPNGPVVLELFTSQSCAFCSQADNLFAEMVKRPNTIGIACHVAYFKGADAQAQDFCRERQDWYMNRLQAGPAYIPQLVVNGSGGAVGYKTDKVSEMVRHGAADGLESIGIEVMAATAAPDDYQITLPDDIIAKGLKGWQLAVLTFKKPVTGGPGPGGDDGENHAYAHIADNMQVLPLDDFRGPGFKLTVPLNEAEDGFIVILQKQDTGKIAAAGQFIRTDDQPVR
jgi:hypothetical protein